MHKKRKLVFYPGKYRPAPCLLGAAVNLPHTWNAVRSRKPWSTGLTRRKSPGPRDTSPFMTPGARPRPILPPRRCWLPFRKRRWLPKEKASRHAQQRIVGEKSFCFGHKSGNALRHLQGNCFRRLRKAPQCPGHHRTSDTTRNKGVDRI